jgi:hypothetical protein
MPLATSAQAIRLRSDISMLKNLGRFTSRH